MKVKFLKGTFHLGYAHRAGDTADYPEDIAKRFIKGGYAVLAGERQRKVKTTQVTRSKKRPVKKK